MALAGYTVKILTSADLESNIVCFEFTESCNATICTYSQNVCRIGLHIEIKITQRFRCHQTYGLNAMSK